VLDCAVSATPILDRRTGFQGRMDSIQNRAVLPQDNALSRQRGRTRLLGGPSGSAQ
jgi:ribosomal protein L34